LRRRNEEEMGRGRARPLGYSIRFTIDGITFIARVMEKEKKSYPYLITYQDSTEDEYVKLNLKTMRLQDKFEHDVPFEYVKESPVTHTMTVAMVKTWVCSDSDLCQYARAFENHEICGTKFSQLTKNIITHELGVSNPEHIQKILGYVNLMPKVEDSRQFSEYEIEHVKSMWIQKKPPAEIAKKLNCTPEVIKSILMPSKKKKIKFLDSQVGEFLKGNDFPVDVQKKLRTFTMEHLIEMKQELVDIVGEETTFQIHKLLSKQKRQHPGVHYFIRKYRRDLEKDGASFYGTRINDEEAIKLANILESNTTLLRLELSWTPIRDKGLAAICDALCINSRIEKLGLSNLEIGVYGAERIAKCFKVNSSLTEIDLTHNKIPPRGLNAIAESLKFNKKIESINISHPIPIVPAGYHQAFNGGLFRYEIVRLNQ